MAPGPRRKLLRWLAWIAAAGVVLGIGLTIAAWLLLESLDMKAVIARVESAVEDATGRALTIGSQPQISFTPLLKVVINDVRLANMADGGTRPEMLKLRRLEIGVDLRPLLHGSPPGVNLVLVQPDLWLEVTERGQANWVLKLDPEDAIRRLKQAVEILSGRVTLDSVRVERAAVRYDDRSQRLALEIGASRAALQIKPDDGYELDIDGALNRRPATIKADFRLPVYGEPVSGRLSATLPGAALTADGIIRLAWPTEGSDVKISAGVDDVQKLGEILGVRFPKLPPIKLAARVTGARQGLRVDPVELSLGRSRFGGSIEMARFEPRPLVRARIDAQVVDLEELFPASAGSAPSKGHGDGRIFSTEKFSLELPRWLDTESRIKVARLGPPKGQAVEAIDANVSLAAGRLKVAPFALTVAGGKMSGRLQLDAPAAKQPSLEAALQAKGVALGGLITLAGLHGEGIRAAPTDIAVDVTAGGDSMRAMMASLNGHVRVVIGEGRLPGKVADWSGSLIGQIVDVLNPYRVSEDGSPLKCAVVNVPVRNGMVTIKDTIAGETDKVVGAVSGTADLGQERLDLILHSQTTGGLTPGLADFASAGKLTGTLAKPQLAVNAKGAAAAGLRIGAAIATVGVTLLAESAVHKAMPAHPCQVALSATPDAAGLAAQSGEASGGEPKVEKKPGFFGRMLGK